MPRPPSESEARSTGYWLALNTLPDPTPQMIAHCRAEWTEQRDAAQNVYIRWGLEGMLTALRALEDNAPTIRRTHPKG